MLAAFVLACVVAFSFAFTPLRVSQDEFWQLKTGKWIVEHGALPKTDIYTYTAGHLPWHNHEWLTQVLMWKLYAWGDERTIGGWRAVILVKSLIIVLAYAGFGMLVARRMARPVWAALAAGMAAALARRTFYPRPPVLTYLLLALVFWMLIEWRAGRLRARWLWLLAPVFALWANLHGGWLAGLVFIGAFWAESGFAFMLQRATGNRQPATGNWQLATALGLACAAATLLNPSGYHLIELTLRVMTGDKYLLPRIGEMGPPDWRFVWIVEGVILTLAAAAIRPVRWKGFAFVAALAAGLHFVFRALPYPWVYTAAGVAAVAAAVARVRPPGALAHGLLGAFFLQQGIYHIRHLPLTAVALLPTLAWSLEGWAAAWSAAGRTRRRERMATLAAICAMVLLSLYWLFSREGFSYAQRNGMLAGGLEFQPMPVNAAALRLAAPSTLPKDGVWTIEAYPVKAVDFMLRTRLPGPIWNSGNYAGYLIWRLAPEKYKLFTDNRYDIWGGLMIREEHSVTDGYDAADLAEMLREDSDYFKGPAPPPWDKVLDKWGIQTVFMPAEARGNGRLAGSGKWMRVWEDFDFNIWVRDTPENQAAIERARAINHEYP